MKEDCIFCKLANGIVPTNFIYEDDTFKVIMDANPSSEGHVLIIPKEHSDDIFGLDDETAKKIMPLAKRVSIKMRDTLACEGINVLQNNGTLAGQTVFHTHVHIVPRYKDESKQGSSEEDIKRVCKMLEF